MIGLEFLRHGNRFAARIRRRYFSAERISRAGNTSAFAGYVLSGVHFERVPKCKLVPPILVISAIWDLGW